MKRRFAVAATMLLLVAGLLLPATRSAAAEQSVLDTVLARGKLIVATFSTAPPLCFADKNGKLDGFEIDIAKMIAKALFNDENKVDFVVVDSPGRWPAVLSGKADFGIATTTIYPDRAVRLAFTRPYMDSGISALVRKDAGVNSLKELNSDKYTLANLSNPQMIDRQKKYLPKVKALTFDTPSAMFLAVKTGQATAMQIDTPIVSWYAANNPELKELPEMLSVVQNNAIFLKPGDFKWWLFLDTVVGELRDGSRFEEYSAAYHKWFGKNPPPQRFYIPAAKQQ